MKKNEEKLNELLKTAADHPMMKVILSDKAAEVFGKRMLAAAKLRAIEEEAEGVVPKLRAEVEALVAELAEYDRGRTAIADRLQAARAELSKTNIHLDLARGRATCDLLANYDPRIDEAITFFRDRIDKLRAKPVNEQTRRWKRNLITETKEKIIFSNAAAITAALNYCRNAVAELESMKLVPDLDDDRIEALKKGVPNADRLTESRLEKALERTDTGLLGRLWSDTERRVDELLGRRHPGVPEWK